MNRNSEKMKKWIETELNVVKKSYGGFAMTSKNEDTLLSSSFACHIFELLGIVSELNLDKKKQWAKRFLDAQSDESGYFIDPKFSINDTVGSHNKDYIYWQFTYFSLHALDILDYNAKYKLNFIEKFKDTEVLAKWLAERKWDNFWLESNNIMFLLFFLTYKLERENDFKCKVIIDNIFDFLDKKQDPETGYWGTDAGSSIFNGMAGASHIYFFYAYFGKKINYLEKIIDSTLQLQDCDGLFSPPGTVGGGSCEDLDAINILCITSLLSSHKKIRVWVSLRKAYRKIKRNSDQKTGSFSYKFNNSEDSWSYSGWNKMSAKFNELDTWSTYFRNLTLAFIEERYGMKNDWKFRKLPSLGWFNKKI